MVLFSLFKLAINVALVVRIAGAEDELNFPKGFLFGAAGSAYQIEGGWNASDKGVSVWDSFTHDFPWTISDRSNGDVACDSYHKYKEDVALIKDLNMDHYRVSISWTRILPNGFPNYISKDGLQYYHNILDELRKYNIEPFVTIYHWDHPAFMEKMGGWTNDLMVDWFADYADVVFREFGPKVKFFGTINEPSSFCVGGYQQGMIAPGKNLSDTGKYLCMHNVLKAHAKAYHLYDEKYRRDQKGLVSIVLPCQAQFAKYPNDTAAVEVDFQFDCGWMANPIFSETGDYPEVMKTRVAENSKILGYKTSLLPEFSKEWINYIKNTADYFSLNHYTARLVETVPRKPGELWYDGTGVKESVNDSWPHGYSREFEIVPEGLRAILVQIKTHYNNPLVYITENGMSDQGTLMDYQRIDYFYSYLKEMLKAIYDDGCDVRGYTAWSLLDNFEWSAGYGPKFGIVNVDFDDPNRKRTPKLSYQWWKDLIRAGKLRESY